MAHEFESGFFVQEPAWHGLGTVLESAPTTAEQAIILAGLDWPVSKVPLLASIQDEDENEVEQLSVPDNFAIVRERMVDGYLTRNTLGVVGSRYEIIQNKKCFEFFDVIIATGDASYETAGSLRDGRIIWILAKLNGTLPIFKDDAVDKYLLLHSSHDGSGSLVVQLNPIRVVCMNTLGMSMHYGDSKEGKINKFSMRHTKSVWDKMENTAEFLQAVNNQFEGSAEQYRVLAGSGINTDKLQEYLTKVFPDPKPKNVTPKMIETQADKLKIKPENVDVEELAAVNNTRVKNIRAEVTELYETGRGTDYLGDHHSLWRGYNAVVEYLDFHRGTNPETRLRSNWFGNGHQMKQHALNEALRLAV